MALALPILLTVDEALRRRRENDLAGGGVKQAHRMLSKLRGELTVPPDQPGGRLGFTREFIDIPPAAAQGDFEWKAYVSNRAEPLIREVVGPGIVGIQGRFIAPQDPNLNQNRFDFIAYRQDGSAVRFHPSSKLDALPVIGYLHDWQLGQQHGPSRSLREQMDGPIAGPGRNAGIYHGISVGDMMTHKTVTKFLQAREQAWHEQTLPAGEKFFKSLVGSHEFPPHLFLARTDEGRSISDAEVVDFYVVWVAGRWHRSGFYVRYEAQPGNPRETVLWPRNEPSSDEAVEAIDWWA